MNDRIFQKDVREKEGESERINLPVSPIPRLPDSPSPRFSPSCSSVSRFRTWRRSPCAMMHWRASQGRACHERFAQNIVKSMNVTEASAG